VQVEIDPNHFFSQPIIFINVTTIYSQVNGTVVHIYILKGRGFSGNSGEIGKKPETQEKTALKANIYCDLQ